MELLNYIEEAEARSTVIALHCAGATGSEWRQLHGDLGPRFLLTAPNLIGNEGADRWAGNHAFTLSDEAAAVTSIMDAVNEPVHLVGHSYGGAVALRAAIERPTQVASLTLYEPAAFHILKTSVDGRIALVEIDAVANKVNRDVLNGAYQGAAKRFFEWANGDSSWEAMDAEARNNIVRYIPKVCIEYHAQVTERTPLMAYSRLNCPVLLLQGEFSLEPLCMIAQRLAHAMKLASLQTVYGAGHMGPFTHAAEVSAMMTNHILSAEERLPRKGNDHTAINHAA
jgi:pimeloyl-ACP methyl ester carboxylesterase